MNASRPASDAEMDARVEAWHYGRGEGATIAEYCGLTQDEYYAWVEGRLTFGSRESDPDIARRALNLLDLVLGQYMRDPWDEHQRFRSRWVVEDVLSVWETTARSLRAALTVPAVDVPSASADK